MRVSGYIGTVGRFFFVTFFTDLLGQFFVTTKVSRPWDCKTCVHAEYLSHV